MPNRNRWEEFKKNAPSDPEEYKKHVQAYKDEYKAMVADNFGLHSGKYYADGPPSHLLFGDSFIKKAPRVDSTRQTPSVSTIDKALAKELATMTFDEYSENFELGDLCFNDEEFCSWDIAVNYPNSYIGKKNYVKAAHLFEEMLEGFVWDFFYLYHPKQYRLPAKLYVPTDQFERFLDWVNATVGIKLTIPEGAPGLSFAITFDIGDCGPRYLGRSTSKAEFEQLLKNLPDWDAEYDGYKDLSEPVIDELIAKLSIRNVDGDKTKEKERAARKREAQDKIKRTELQLLHHLLGLRPVEKTYHDAEGKPLQLDTAKPAPFKPYRDAVIASIDIEVAEEASNTIYEIGISILDTRDIVNVAPGEEGRDWHGQIKSHHLLTYEWRACRNSKYVKGCPDMFNFGESELPKEEDLPKRLLAILKQHVYPDGVTDNDWELHRPLVVIGHGFRSDQGFLKSMGVNLDDIYSFATVIDTQHMDQIVNDVPQARNLATVLNELEIKHTYLHNAGNDAAYTLQALITMAVKTRIHEVAELAELNEELGEDTGKVAAPAAEATLAVKEFDETLRKKRRPGEDANDWRMRYHGVVETAFV